MAIFISMALFAISFRCEKGDYVEPKIDYHFSEQLTLTPYRKVYAVNDTLWIQFQTADKSLFDRLTRSRIATDTTFLQWTVYYHRLYPIGTVEEAFADIRVENAIDVTFKPLYSWYNMLTFRTDCSNNAYFFKVGFVPKKQGVYSLEPGSWLSNCPNKLVAKNSNFQLRFDLADCNKDVWSSIPPQARGGQTGHTDVRIDNKEIFVFKVE